MIAILYRQPLALSNIYKIYPGLLAGGHTFEKIRTKRLVIRGSCDGTKC
jgi:hypothetical protein